MDMPANIWLDMGPKESTADLLDIHFQIYQSFAYDINKIVDSQSFQYNYETEFMQAEDVSNIRV